MRTGRTEFVLPKEAAGLQVIPLRQGGNSGKKSLANLRLSIEVDISQNKTFPCIRSSDSDAGEG